MRVDRNVIIFFANLPDMSRRIVVRGPEVKESGGDHSNVVMSLDKPTRFVRNRDELVRIIDYLFQAVFPTIIKRR